MRKKHDQVTAAAQHRAAEDADEPVLQAVDNLIDALNGFRTAMDRREPSPRARAATPFRTVAAPDHIRS